jgi:CBS domain-containing protein
MRVRDGMSSVVLTVGPSHSLSAAARLMTERNVGAAVVVDPDGAGFGILTERDILRSVAGGEDPAVEAVAKHLTEDLIFAAPDWSLEQAAEAMLQGGFRHLLVVDGAELEGILSMRDIVRCWNGDRVAG